jgi:hypothetical protein
MTKGQIEVIITSVERRRGCASAEKECDGQGRALSARKSRAYEGYAKRTMERANERDGNRCSE